MLLPHQLVIAATPIYIRPDGDDTSCNGEYNAPVSAAPNCAIQTINRGISLVDPGGTVYVDTGTLLRMVLSTRIFYFLASMIHSVLKLPLSMVLSM